MAFDGSPLAVLAQQGAEGANVVIAEKSVGIPGGNLPSVIMIGQGMPEVKLRHRQVQIAVRPSMTRGGALLRTAPHGNTVVNGMTSTTLLKIGSDSGSERRPHSDGL
jgi:hypothetical protein